jgi:hypothetical protein
MVMSVYGPEHVVKHENAHARPDNLDPKVNGPYLDDVRREQERAYREARNKKADQAKNEVVDDDTQDLEPVEEEKDNG